MTAQPVEDLRETASHAHEDDGPPRTPRWVKAMGIFLVVALLLYAGLHLTGNAPSHMPGTGGAQHGMQAP